MRNLSVGIDIGGTSTTVGIVDRNGNIICLNNSPEDAIVTTDFVNKPGEAYIDRLCEVILRMVERAGGLNEIEGIGIGAPNGSYKTGTIENPPNLPWKMLEIVDLIKQRIKLDDVYLDNDANAAALGEWKYGGARGCNDFIIITLGTGLGSGIVAEGKLVRGSHGLGGELGHTIITRRYGRKCGCGRHGCLEAYASAKGMARTAIEFLEIYSGNSPLKVLYDGNKEMGLSQFPEKKRRERLFITSEDIYNARLQDDPLAIEIFEYTGKILGEALADFVACTDPEAIFFFGGLAHSGEFLLKPARESMQQSLLNIYTDKNIKLEVSMLNNNAQAAVLGASALVWEGK